MQQLAVIVLAAGKGKRMGNPDLPKVMAALRTRPLISWVLDQAAKLQPQRTIVVVGHHREMVQEYLGANYPTVSTAVQAEQLGTGHAVAQCEEALRDFDGPVLILSGDVPLLRSVTLADFVQDHYASKAAVSVLSCIAPDPTGYGRIIRSTDGEFESIVEHKDATEEQRLCAEINSGIYVIESCVLFKALSEVKNVNAQGEYYLTDVIGILRSQNQRVMAFCCPEFQELMGINTAAELALAEEALDSLQETKHS